ncbi:MAG: Lrp/AsnC family transcriptional regulator [Candidatus Micrarchaeota archaeon]|nr:Lrp/AsnC family transcriptional regulator [Candidatus Micrarchaeota archaeon]MDE1849518.1 Lrp/AsnC family transcriptional regulator [Candidatus Micrarchaeota archaeon]
MDIKYDFKSSFNDRYNLVTRRILRMLSENSRASVSSMSLALKISRKSVVERIRRLEKEIGISYALEFNEEKLGLFNPHLIRVSFSKVPDWSHVAELLKASYIPQFAASVKGDYDMMIYANAPSRQDYVHWDKGMQQLLSDYGVKWRSSEIAHRQLGFFPLRGELLDKTSIPDKYKGIAKVLNSNARISFNGISKVLEMHFNTVAYNFKKLQDTGYIKRFTILMDKPDSTSILVYFGSYTISGKFEANAVQSRKNLMSDDEYSMISRYPFCCQLIGSADFFAMGMFDDEKAARRYGIGNYKKTMVDQKPKVSYGTLEKVLLGRLPLRAIDTKKEYNIVRWTTDSMAIAKEQK